MKFIALLTALLLLVLPASQAQAPGLGYWDRTPLPQIGLATYYGQGLMEYVSAYRRDRGQLPDCPDCVGEVALLRAGDIGRKIWLQAPGLPPAGPFLVVDCARRQDVEPLLARGWVVDISFELGRLWGMARPLADVTVLEDPADQHTTVPVGLPTRFFIPPDELVISTPTPTPAVTSPAPTPWPTRIPEALPGQSVPVETPLTLSRPTSGPPPLTPIITTPTPLPGAVESLPSAEPASTGAPTATAAAIEIALGRPGAQLLSESTPQVSVSATIWAPSVAETPSPTPSRTPRPGLTPLLPAVLATPQPTPTGESGLLRLWQSILSLVFD